MKIDKNTFISICLLVLLISQCVTFHNKNKFVKPKKDMKRDVSIKKLPYNTVKDCEGVSEQSLKPQGKFHKIFIKSKRKYKEVCPDAPHTYAFVNGLEKVFNCLLKSNIEKTFVETYKRPQWINNFITNLTKELVKPDLPDSKILNLDTPKKTERTKLFKMAEVAKIPAKGSLWKNEEFMTLTLEDNDIVKEFKAEDPSKMSDGPKTIKINFYSDPGKTFEGKLVSRCIDDSSKSNRVVLTVNTCFKVNKIRPDNRGVTFVKIPCIKGEKYNLIN